MKKTRLNACVLLLIGSLLVACGSLLVACGSTRNLTPSVIGIVPLTSYSRINSADISDTTYHVIQNEETFSANFRASSADAKKPGFNGQMVVALLTPQPSLLQFDRADHSGPRINIYLRTCTPASSLPACNSSNFFLATIPKVGDARSVQFYIDNTSKRIVDL